jgi:CheY-like chemotaxis protein
MPSDTRMKQLSGRVLVVDDMPDGRMVIAKILRSAGLEVATAKNGKQAHDQAMTASIIGRPYDLVLMDMQMPVRSHNYEGRIAALTGMGDVREKCLTAGCDEYITKPISLETLLSMVERNVVKKPSCKPEAREFTGDRTRTATTNYAIAIGVSPLAPFIAGVS